MLSFIPRSFTIENSMSSQEKTAFEFVQELSMSQRRALNSWFLSFQDMEGHFCPCLPALASDVCGAVTRDIPIKNNLLLMSSFDFFVKVGDKWVKFEKISKELSYYSVVLPSGTVIFDETREMFYSGTFPYSGKTIAYNTLKVQESIEIEKIEVTFKKDTIVLTLVGEGKVEKTVTKSDAKGEPNFLSDLMVCMRSCIPPSGIIALIGEEFENFVFEGEVDRIVLSEEHSWENQTIDYKYDSYTNIFVAPSVTTLLHNNVKIRECATDLMYVSDKVHFLYPDTNFVHLSPGWNMVDFGVFISHYHLADTNKGIQTMRGDKFVKHLKQSIYLVSEHQVTEQNIGVRYRSHVMATLVRPDFEFASDDYSVGVQGYWDKIVGDHDVQKPLFIEMVYRYCNYIIPINVHYSKSFKDYDVVYGCTGQEKQYLGVSSIVSIMYGSSCFASPCEIWKQFFTWFGINDLMADNPVYNSSSFYYQISHAFKQVRNDNHLCDLKSKMSNGDYFVYLHRVCREFMLVTKSNYLVSEDRLESGNGLVRFRGHSWDLKDLLNEHFPGVASVLK